MNNYNFTLDNIIPYNKDEYENFEGFYKKIEFNAHKYMINNITEDLKLTFNLLYNLDEESYKTIVLSRFEFKSLRKIAGYVNKALISSEPVENTLAMFDMYNEMSACIVKFISGVYKRYSKYKEEKVNELIKDNYKAISICQNNIYDNITAYITNVLLNEFADSLMSYEKVSEQLNLHVDERIKFQRKNAERNDETRYVGYVVASQEKYRRAHHGHKK